MTAEEIVRLLLALAALLGAARILGEIARRLNQPAVVGELLAGILLGPTVLGQLAPQAMEFLFKTGKVPTVIEGVGTIAICLFLLVAGMEVDLSTVWRQGRTALSVSVLGIVIPFGVAFLAALGIPLAFGPGAIGRDVDADPMIFALFFGTALSITALPVIAKTLMDLDLYRSEMGMIIIASATFDDLTGWIIFAVLLGLMGQGAHGLEVWQTILLTLGFAAVMLTVGRWLIHRTLPWIQAHLSWPGGVLGFAMTLTFLGAAFTEWVGVHAIFGAFLVGVALGDSNHLRERTRSTIEQFVSFIFAPLFFATVGLKVNFLENFDAVLVLVVLVIACAGKLIGCGLAGRWAGMAPRQALAMGLAMNGRGAMEIILGLLALEAGLINVQMFVALVVMALATSMMAGPLMQKVLQRKKPKPFTNYVGARSFIPDLKARDRESAIRELVAVSGAAGVPLDQVAEAVIERERITPTGLGMNIALPHARIEGLKAPQIATGVSRQGIDFDAADGEPAHIIVLILTPASETALSLELYREILHRFRDRELRERVLRVNTYTEFLALLASAPGLKPHGVTTSMVPALQTGPSPTPTKTLFKE